MEKQVQYIMVGLPFSGKTTLSKAVSEQLNIPRVNLDEVKSEMGFGHLSDNDLTSGKWKEIFDETDRRVLDHLKSGKSVLHETSWTKRWKRDRARKLATDLGINSVVIYVNIPESISRDRLLKNRIKHTRPDVPDDVYGEAVAEFEIPTPDENLLVFDQSDEVDVWIQKHFHY